MKWLRYKAGKVNREVYFKTGDREFRNERFAGFFVAKVRRCRTRMTRGLKTGVSNIQ